MIRLGTIGSNFIVDLFLEGVKVLDGIELCAVYSRSMEKGKAFAAKYGAKKVYDNLEEMAADQELDMIYVASPACCHYKQSMLMLNYGKHVLCEKPVASNSTELHYMIHAAKKNKVVFMEAMRPVHTPGFQMVKDHLDQLGTIRRMTLQYCQYSSRYDHFKEGIIENAFNPKLSNGAMTDIGVYCIHFLAALWGMPKKILADSIKLENGVDGAGTIVADYGDKQAEIMYSKITDSILPSQIQGEDGVMIIEQCPNPRKIFLQYRNGERKELSFDSRENSMIYETADFIDLIKKKEVDHKYLEASVIEMKIMDEARRQGDIVFPADTINQ